MFHLPILTYYNISQRQFFPLYVSAPFYWSQDISFAPHFSTRRTTPPLSPLRIPSTLPLGSPYSKRTTHLHASSTPTCSIPPPFRWMRGKRRQLVFFPNFRSQHNMVMAPNMSLPKKTRFLQYFFPLLSLSVCLSGLSPDAPPWQLMV